MIKKLLSITLFALASLTSLARPHGEAFAILIEKANITGQCFHFYDQWSTQDVEDIWNQGRNAKSVNYTRAGWLAISQKESADQKYKYNSFKEIKKAADNEAKNGIFLHSLTLAEVGTRWYWIGLSENRPNISRQVVEMVKTSKLNQWMAEKAQQGLKVINCARKITECAVVAHDRTDIDRQEACLYETAQEALNDVKRHWEAGWRVGLVDVSPMNKYTIVYNTYTTPREGEQYLAFCDSRESAKNFINEHAHNGYFITHVGGAFYPGATDENGNPMSFMQIMSGLVSTTANLVGSINGGKDGGGASDGGGSDGETANTASCRTQEDYQREYDKWAEKARHAALSHYKSSKIDNQTGHKSGEITAGNRKILRNYQKLMRGVADAASKAGFTLKRADIESFVP